MTKPSRLFGAVVEIAGKGARGCKPGDPDAADSGLRAPGDHHVRVFELNDPGRVADGMRARGTGRDRGMVRPLETMPDRYLAGSKVDQDGGQKERRDPPGSAFVQCDGGFVYAGQAADAGANHNAGTLTILVTCRLPAGIIDCLLCRHHGIQDEIAHFAGVFGRDPFVRVEIAVRIFSGRHLTTDLN
jgi:hypothetical protein